MCFCVRAVEAGIDHIIVPTVHEWFIQVTAWENRGIQEVANILHMHMNDEAEQPIEFKHHKWENVMDDNIVMYCRPNERDPLDIVTDHVHDPSNMHVN